MSGKRRKKYQAVVSVGKDWVDGRIVRRQKSIGVFETRREAQAALDEWTRTGYNVDRRNTTFAEVCDIVLPEFTTSMQAAFRTGLKHCSNLHGMRMVDIRKCDLDIVAKEAESLSRSSQNKIKIVVSAVFRWAYENDIIIKDYSPMLQFKESAETRKKSSYSADEIKLVLADGTDLMKILLYTGMRISELLNMPSDALYEEDGVLCFHVREGKTSNSVRIVPVHSEILGLVYPPTGNHIITPHKSYHYHAHVLEQWNERHGMSHTFHELRHTFATYTKTCGLDDFYRRALLGHTQKGLTDQVYTDVLVSDLKRQIELLKYPSQ